MLFGNKDIFAIEIGFGKSKTWDDLKKNLRLKCKTRFWANGNSIGLFKIYGELQYLKWGVKDIIENEASMWEDVFENKSDKEIFCEISLCGTNFDDLSTEDLKRFEYFSKYRVFFGDQFDDSEILTVVKGNKICFLCGLYSKKDKLSSIRSAPANVQKECVSLDYFYKVCKELFNELNLK